MKRYGPLSRAGRHDVSHSIAHGTLENRRNEVTNRANEESVSATCRVACCIFTCVWMRVYPTNVRHNANNSLRGSHLLKWINGDRERAPRKLSLRILMTHHGCAKNSINNLRLTLITCFIYLFGCFMRALDSF